METTHAQNSLHISAGCSGHAKFAKTVVFVVMKIKEKQTLNCACPEQIGLVQLSIGRRV